MTFDHNSFLWLDVRTFIQSVLLYWSVYCKQVLCEPIKLLGKHSSVLVARNSSHLLRYPLGHGNIEILVLERQLSGPDKQAVYANDATYIHMISQYVLGSVYQRLKARLKHTERASWPPLMELLHHVRNGCVHNNQYNFQNTIYGTPKWKHVDISKKREGNNVMGLTNGDFGPADVILFIHDLQKSL